jgi:hypothetical protein
MASSRHFLYELLNQKRISWLFVAIATISKSILVAVFSNYETDKSFFLLMAKNLSAGDGFTIPVSLISNPAITENIYLPSAASPLYSIIAAPLLRLFPDNYFLVSWLIESLSWLLLFIVLRKLLFRLTENHYWTNLFIIFSGVFLYTVELSSSSKDVLALALLFFALLRCITIASAGSRPSVVYIVVTALLFFLPGLTKLTYLPLTIVFPLSLLFIGFLKNEKRILRYGSITLLLSVLLVAIHYFYFHSLEKQTLALYPDFYAQRWSMAKSGDDYVAGFFPENLKVLYPFMPASVINLDFMGVQVKTHLYSVYTIYGTLLYTINFIGLAVFIAVFFFMTKKYFRKFISDRIFFLLSGMFISLAIITLLSFMSVRYHAVEYKGSVSSWTYVYESRSFLFPIVFLQLCLFVFLFSKKQTAAFTHWLRTFFLLIVAISFVHGAYFLAKKSISLRSPKQKAVSVNGLVTNEADSIQKANPGYVVWLATEMSHLDWYAKLHTQKVLNGLAFLNDSSFRLPPNTILLTAIAKEDTANISTYLRRAGVKQIRNYDNTYYIFQQEAVR